MQRDCASAVIPADRATATEEISGNRGPFLVGKRAHGREPTSIPEILRSLSLCQDDIESRQSIAEISGRTA
jgi:hypothetical protein